MRSSRIALSVLLLGLAAACSASAPPAPPRAPAAGPAGGIPELDHFVGTWAVAARDPSTGKTFEMTYRITPALAGRWYIGTGHVPSMGLEIHDLWGKDPQTGEIVRTVFDSAPNFGTVRSRGWNGDTLVFEGEVATPGGRARVRETIRKVGPDELRAVWEELRGDTWTAYSEEILRRVR